MGLIDVYLVDAVEWYTIASTSGSGKKTYNAATNLFAKIINREELFKSASSGERRLSKTQIVVAPTVGISVGDRIIIDSVKYEIDFVGVGRAFKKTDHKKAYLI